MPAKEDLASWRDQWRIRTSGLVGSERGQERGTYRSEMADHGGRLLAGGSIALWRVKTAGNPSGHFRSGRGRFKALVLPFPERTEGNNFSPFPVHTAR